MLKNKKILIGVTGGIAAYKTCELIRALVKAESDVRVVMTEASQQFITALTFETLTGNAVHRDPFEQGTKHIELARWADCIVVCPATANTIAKVASGLADNLLTTIILAANVPVVFCPAMNVQMYLNPLFQRNMAALKQLSYRFVESEQGELACGEHGWGRLADTAQIIDSIQSVLYNNPDLHGKRVLVTAGPTVEDIDPVRFISNRSSGKMGFALAEAAMLRGAEVTLISGPTRLKPLSGMNYKTVRSAGEMHDEVFKCWEDVDILMMAAAVSDYKARQIQNQKIKKQDESLVLELDRTADILHEAGQKKGKRMLIGFALETDHETENAIRKMMSKNLDLIVLNNPLEEGAGFDVDTNRVTLIDSSKQIIELTVMSKIEVAHRIIDHIIIHMQNNEFITA
ncbi:bifunctional phosphopantothenoylcysteine decarboxylase/phosphopantothenate--cysteine ligase CoaBC [candidate division KSB1 bacterium]|nr:bifunctional phosphopantothenoylcysteine decarboxylase/phosphopantothenate--cysteine ligase CoaBC [candidate division KSB1 bacterium]